MSDANSNDGSVGPQVPDAGAGATTDTGRQVVSPGFTREEPKPFPLVPVAAGGVGLVVVAGLIFLVVSSLGGGSGYAKDVAKNLPANTEMMWAADSPDAIMSALGELGVHVEGLEDALSGDELDDILVDSDDAMRASALKEIGIDPKAPVGGGEFSVERENFHATVVSFGATGGADEMEAFVDLLDWDDTEDEEFGGYAAITSASDETPSYMYSGRGVIRIGKRMLWVEAYSAGSDLESNFDDQREVIQAALEHLAELESDDSLAETEAFKLAMKQGIDADLMGINFLDDDDRERLEDEFVDADALLFVMGGLKLSRSGAAITLLAGFDSEEAYALQALEALKLKSGVFSDAPGEAAGLLAFALEREQVMELLREQVETTGEDIDDAFAEFEEVTDVDLAELLEALDFSGGVVLPEDIGAQLVQRALRGRFGTNSNPLFEDDFYMFVGVADHEVALEALENLEDALESEGVDVESDEVGEGVMLTLANRGDEFAIGLTKKVLWVGDADAVEGAMEGSRKTLGSESGGLISALPRRAALALTADLGLLLEDLVDELADELDMDLPDADELFGVASATLAAEGQTLRVDIALPFDVSAFRAAMEDR